MQKLLGWLAFGGALLVLLVGCGASRTMEAGRFCRAVNGATELYFHVRLMKDGTKDIACAGGGGPGRMDVTVAPGDAGFGSETCTINGWTFSNTAGDFFVDARQAVQGATTVPFTSCSQ